MKIVTVVGARPQFIKAAAMSRAFEGAGASVTDVLVHTGQHYDYEMSQVFFEGLDLPEPQHYLGVGSAGHGEQTGEMMKRLEPVIGGEQPDVVLVHGDTNSTMAGALVAVKLHVPVAHVEAGLRSHRLDMPEEVNRVVTDHVSSYLYCPTETAAKNLADEGMTQGVVVCGDVMRDVLESAVPQAERRVEMLADLGVEPGEYAAATVHRSENTDVGENLEAIFRGLAKVAESMPVVLPLHPRTKAALGGSTVEEVKIIDPLGYADMVCLTRNARVVLTDSGGLQKEAYWLGVPCVTMRNETEWVETLEGGWNMLAGADPERIEAAAARPLPAVDRDESFGGRGAPEAIVSHLAAALGRDRTAAQ